MSPKKACVKQEEKDDDDVNFCKMLNNYRDNALGKAVALLDKKERSSKSVPRSIGSNDLFRRTKESLSVYSIMLDSLTGIRCGSNLSAEMLTNLVIGQDAKLFDPHAKVQGNSNDIFAVVPHAWAWEKILSSIMSGEDGASVADGEKDELLRDLVRAHGNKCANVEAIVNYYEAITTDACALECSYVAKPIRIILLEASDLRMLKFHPRRVLIKRLLMELSANEFSEMFEWLKCPELEMNGIEVR